MFEWAGDFISNSWTGLTDAIGGIATGTSQFVTGFFPTPQRQLPISSQISLPATTAGLNFRPTAPEAQSVLESAAQAASDWIGSPFEAQFGPSEFTGPPKPWNLPFRDTVEGLWAAATGTISVVGRELPGMLVTKIQDILGLSTETVVVNTQGDTETVFIIDRDRGPATVPAPTQQQPAGSFSIGFPQWAQMPIVPIPGTAKSINAGTILLVAGAGLIIFWFVRK